MKKGKVFEKQLHKAQYSNICVAQWVVVHVEHTILITYEETLKYSMKTENGQFWFHMTHFTVEHNI